MFVEPFLKWPGGKRRLLGVIGSVLPQEIGTYWEPFLGGGAVFFAFCGRMKRAVLSDVNQELVETYIQVRDDLDGVVEELEAHARNHEKDDGHYCRVRGQVPKDPLKRAARMLYLNKRCFNGLYRLNGKGEFNAPQGIGSSKICDKRKLARASEALQMADIRQGSYESIRPRKGDVVYCDPPYDGSAADYGSGFDRKDHERLRNTVASWAGKGVRVAVSSSGTEYMRRLYADMDTTEVSLPHLVGGQNGRKKRSKELLSTVGFRRRGMFQKTGS